METFVMLIILLQLDPDDHPYTTALQESPRHEYVTLAECESAAQTKRNAMLRSSVKYPNLAIVDVMIRCVDNSEQDFDPRDIVI